MAPPIRTSPHTEKCCGYQRITSLSASTALTWPANARWALIVPETQAVRWREDGTDPTATIGMPLSVAQYFEYTGTRSALRFIEQTAGAVLHASYYA